MLSSKKLGYFLGAIVLLSAPVAVDGQMVSAPGTKAIPKMEDLPMADGPFKGTPRGARSIKESAESTLASVKVKILSAKS